MLKGIQADLLAQMTNVINVLLVIKKWVKAKEVVVK
jgi:hypothetical protein